LMQILIVTFFFLTWFILKPTFNLQSHPLRE
jgi:hypothetical protein